MKKTYFKPQIKVVKLHGRKQLLTGSSKAMVHSTKTNLGEDKIDFGGSSDNDEGDGFAR